jgi:hypothetical protein
VVARESKPKRKVFLFASPSRAYPIKREFHTWRGGRVVDRVGLENSDPWEEVRLPKAALNPVKGEPSGSERVKTEEEGFPLCLAKPCGSY